MKRHSGKASKIELTNSLHLGNGNTTRDENLTMYRYDGIVYLY